MTGRIHVAIGVAIFALMAGPTAEASEDQPTPSEFRAWLDSGKYHGWECWVPDTGGNVVVRQSAAGQRVGLLASGTSFYVGAAVYDKSRRIWYRIDVVPNNSRVRGWVAAENLICSPSHFD